MGTYKVNFYSNQDLLELIWKSGIFNDSKEFVDMSLREELTPTIREELFSNQDNPKQLLKTIHKYFKPPTTAGQLMPVHQRKSTRNVKFITTIKDPQYKKWASDLCGIWKELVREIPIDVKKNEAKYSLIYLEKPFVVPGGRFREMYYWDTYWTIIGLLHSQMFDVAKGTIENLLSLVKRYGFVPNGNRKYYVNRSQPPFLTLMVRKYFEVTNDREFVKTSLTFLLKEYEFWMKHRTIEISTSLRTFTLNQYRAFSTTPRPESYKEDLSIMLKTVGCHSDISKQLKLYSNIASAAESGWDFSSRWLKGKMNMESISTQDIIPLDLNCIMGAVEFSLAFLHQVIDETKESIRFQEVAEKRLMDINDFFWNDAFGLWCDFDLESNSLIPEYYASVFFIFWLNGFCDVQSFSRNHRQEKAMDKLKALGVFDYHGIPTSLINSGQQWDFPNVWPPLQHTAVKGLMNSTNFQHRKLGESLAKRFIENCYVSWKTQGCMFEKYDVTRSGKAGEGGEYEVQEGFGWTNAVVIDFLHMFGHRWKSPNID